MGENVNDRLEQAMHGQPELNIDEHKRYLGSLRERVFVRLTVAEMQDKQTIARFIRHFADFAHYQILINGKQQQSTLLNQVIMTASKKDTKFRLVSDDTARTEPEATGLLVVAPTAINEEQIDFAAKYPAQ